MEEKLQSPQNFYKEQTEKYRLIPSAYGKYISAIPLTPSGSHSDFVQVPNPKIASFSPELPVIGPLGYAAVPAGKDIFLFETPVNYHGRIVFYGDRWIIGYNKFYWIDGEHYGNLLLDINTPKGREAYRVKIIPDRFPPDTIPDPNIPERTKPKNEKMMRYIAGLPKTFEWLGKIVSFEIGW